jgi:hypothetical protein
MDAMGMLGMVAHLAVRRSLALAGRSKNGHPS